MKNYLTKMPLGKKLSYLFDRVAKRDVLCTRMACEVRPVDVFGEFSSRRRFTMNRQIYMWFEARPVPGENGLYSIKRHNYTRNEMGHLVTGNRKFRTVAYRRTESDGDTGPYLTRAEAIDCLKRLEKEMLKDHAPVEKTPWVLRAHSIHGKRHRQRHLP